MESNVVFYAMYNDDEVLKEGAKKVIAKGVKVAEVFSPFPVHGLDPILGLKESRLGIMSFIYGLTGLTLAIIGMNYFMISDWPMNIGGKPSFSFLENLLAFVPIAFEMTVLFAAHAMAISYLIVNKTIPGMPAVNPDPRTTDDRFIMELRLNENSKFSEKEIEAMLMETGIVELDQKNIK